MHILSTQLDSGPSAGENILVIIWDDVSLA